MNPRTAPPNPCRRLQLVEPGKQVTDPAGRLAIYPQLAGVERYNETTKAFEFNDRAYGHHAKPEQIEKRHRLIAAWNAGERFAE